MRKLQFSLASVLVGVSIIAAWCAALRFASELWATLWFSLAIGAVLTAVVGAIFRRGEPRAFWTGFILFGSSYLLLVFGPWFDGNVRQHLLTERLLLYLHPKLQQATQKQVILSLVDGTVVSGDRLHPRASNSLPLPAGLILGGPTPVSTSENFSQIGHSILAVAMGLLGGILSRLFWHRSQSDQAVKMAPRGIDLRVT
jgi:hypothetical protein